MTEQYDKDEILQLIMEKIDSSSIVKRSKRWSGYHFNDKDDVEATVKELLNSVLKGLDKAGWNKHTWAATAGMIVYHQKGRFIVSWDESMTTIVWPRTDDRSGGFERTLMSMPLIAIVDYVGVKRKQKIEAITKEYNEN